MSDIAAAGARDEQFMPGRVLLLKNQYTPVFLGGTILDGVFLGGILLDEILLNGILLNGIYGTKEPGWARSDDYQIVIFIQLSVLAVRVTFDDLAGQNSIRFGRFKTAIEFII
jgi:hypothetical protein